MTIKLDARVLMLVFTHIAGGRPNHAKRLVENNPAELSIDVKVSCESVRHAVKGPTVRQELPSPVVELDAGQFKTLCSYVQHGAQGRKYALHIVNDARFRLGYRKDYDDPNGLPKVDDPEGYISQLVDQLNKVGVKR